MDEGQVGPGESKSDTAIGTVNADCVMHTRAVSGEENGANVKKNSANPYTCDTMRATDNKDIVGVRVFRLIGQAQGRIAQERSRKEKGSSIASYAATASTTYS